MMEAPQYDPWPTECLDEWSLPLEANTGSAVWEDDPKLAVVGNAIETLFHDGHASSINAADGAVPNGWVLLDMFPMW